eukprot:gene20453-22469_t
MATGRISIELSYLILLFSNLILYSANQQSAIAPSRYFFERIQHEGEENEDKQEEAISLVEFHRCSLDEQCSFVVKKSKDDNPLHLNVKEIDLKGYYAIWKKVEKPSFGDVIGNYWLGLEALHQLTSTGETVLRIDLRRDDSIWAYAEYNGFKIQSEAQKYKLKYTSYTGTAGDALSKNKNQPFSTYDSDNDAASWNCAASWKGAWWHHDCFFANLNNGYYNTSVPQSLMPSTMSWKSDWTDLKFGRIIYSEMKLRRL